MSDELEAMYLRGELDDCYDRLEKANAELAQTQAILKQWCEDLESERSRRVAAQEALNALRKAVLDLQQTGHLVDDPRKHINSLTRGRIDTLLRVAGITK